MRLLDHYKMASAFARSLSDFCKERGIDLSTAADKRGIDPACFHDVTQFISLGAFASLMEDLAAVSGNDCFGLEFADFFTLGDSGPYGFGLMNAPTLGEAIKFHREFIKLTADYAHFSAAVGTEQTEISWSYSALMVACAQYADLMTRLQIRQFGMHAGRDWLPGLVKLVRSRPQSAQLHRDRVCPAIEFDNDVNLIAFASEYLSTSSSSADPRLFELMQQQCRAALAKREQDVPLELRVRREILQRLEAGGFELPAIARQMGLSERSLQRSLREHATSYDALLNETRLELAEQLFRNEQLTMEQIALKLGYGSPAAFFRAVKKWYGLPPGEVRKTLV